MKIENIGLKNMFSRYSFRNDVNKSADKKISDKIEQLGLLTNQTFLKKSEEFR